MTKKKSKEEEDSGLTVEERMEYMHFEVLAIKRMFVMHILRQQCPDFDADSKEFEEGSTFCGPCFAQEYCPQFVNLMIRRNSN